MPRHTSRLGKEASRPPKKKGEQSGGLGWCSPGPALGSRVSQATPSRPPLHPEGCSSSLAAQRRAGLPPPGHRLTPRVQPPLHCTEDGVRRLGRRRSQGGAPPPQQARPSPRCGGATLSLQSERQGGWSSGSGPSDLPLRQHGDATRASSVTVNLKSLRCRLA